MPRAIAVRDYMTRSLVTFTPEMDILEAIGILIERQISGAPVIDKLGNLIGMLSEKDCMRVALSAGYYEYLGGQVSEFMHPRVETVEADMNIIDVARMFMEGGYRRYPVMQDYRLVGQISRRDVLTALQTLSRAPG